MLGNSRLSACQTGAMPGLYNDRRTFLLACGRQSLSAKEERRCKGRYPALFFLPCCPVSAATIGCVGEAKFGLPPSARGKIDRSAPLDAVMQGSHSATTAIQQLISNGANARHRAVVLLPRGVNFEWQRFNCSRESSSRCVRAMLSVLGQTQNPRGCI